YCGRAKELSADSRHNGRRVLRQFAPGGNSNGTLNNYYRQLAVVYPRVCTPCNRDRRILLGIFTGESDFIPAIPPDVAPPARLRVCVRIVRRIAARVGAGRLRRDSRHGWVWSVDPELLPPAEDRRAESTGFNFVQGPGDEESHVRVGRPANRGEGRGQRQ